ncbi:MAG: urease accessory protein UreE [Alphaproteobacteria bacterium]|nr:urease accessory protein UreE [Alphaproteobacteria bacterium]
MRRAIEAVPKGTWPLKRRIGTATLDLDHRHRRRIRLETDAGVEFLLDLAEARMLAPGDGLILDNGDVVEVRAADEAVCDVTAESPAALARLAWHLGNRHLPIEIRADRLRIRDDHVIVAMLRGLGATVTPLRGGFTPEAGAYAQAEAEAHAHHGDKHGHHEHHDHQHGHHKHGHRKHGDHDHGQHEYAQHKHGHHEQGVHEHGHHEHGRHEHGHHEHGRHEHGDHDHGDHGHGNGHHRRHRHE